MWRYLDIVKLLDMLDRRALYLARADTMMDPWEAVMPPLSVDAHIDRIREQVGSRLESPETLKDEYVAFQRQTRSRTFISCWYVSQHESAAMWDLYGGREGRGVAIQSTFHRLEQALPKEWDYTLVAGLVNYIDFAADTMPGGNAYGPVLHKRISFEHERELRVVADTRSYPGETVGLNVPTDVEHLIERLYVSPLSPPWITDLLRRTTLKYGLPVPVEQSVLASLP